MLDLLVAILLFIVGVRFIWFLAKTWFAFACFSAVFTALMYLLFLF